MAQLKLSHFFLKNIDFGLQKNKFRVIYNIPLFEKFVKKGEKNEGRRGKKDF